MRFSSFRRHFCCVSENPRRRPGRAQGAYPRRAHRFARGARGLAALLAPVAAALLAPASALALPPEEEPPFYAGIYAGGGLGASHGADVDRSTLSDPFDAQDIAIQIVDDEEGWELGWHAFLGYQPCRFFAVEGAYTSLGSFDFEAQMVEDPGRFVAELSPRAWSLSGLVTTPPWKGLSAFGRVGAAFWKAELDVDERLGAGLLARGDDARGTSLVWGFGARFDFMKHVGLRAEWERFENVGERDETGRADFDVVLASLVFSF